MSSRPLFSSGTIVKYKCYAHSAHLELYREDHCCTVFMGCRSIGKLSFTQESTAIHKSWTERFRQSGPLLWRVHAWEIRSSGNMFHVWNPVEHKCNHNIVSRFHLDRSQVTTVLNNSYNGHLFKSLASVSIPDVPHEMEALSKSKEFAFFTSKLIPPNGDLPLFHYQKWALTAT